MTANLHMKFDNIYQLALSIPVEDCQRFSIHPLTWLRYLAFTISGCEGIISSQPDGAEVQYYEADIQSGNYYYISQGTSYFGIQRMFAFNLVRVIPARPQFDGRQNHKYNCVYWPG